MVAAAHIRIDWLALAIGAGLAALATVGWQVERGTQVPAATVTLLTAPSQDLAVTADSEAATRDLRASTPEEGLERTLTVRNATGEALDVRLRAETAPADLDGALEVRVQAGGRTIFEGPLKTLQAGTPRSFQLASHETTGVSVLAWIPVTAADDTWRARSEQVRLEFVTTPTPTR